MNQREIVKDYCDYVANGLRDKDLSEVDGFVENYDEDEHDEVFDLITSVEYKVMTKEEFEELKEYEYMYKDLQK